MKGCLLLCNHLKITCTFRVTWIDCVQGCNWKGWGGPPRKGESNRAWPLFKSCLPISFRRRALSHEDVCAHACVREKSHLGKLSNLLLVESPQMAAGRSPSEQSTWAWFGTVFSWRIQLQTGVSCGVLQIFFPDL